MFLATREDNITNFQAVTWLIFQVFRGFLFIAKRFSVLRNRHFPIEKQRHDYLKKSSKWKAILFECKALEENLANCWSFFWQFLQLWHKAMCYCLHSLFWTFWCNKSLGHSEPSLIDTKRFSCKCYTILGKPRKLLKEVSKNFERNDHL